MTEAGKMYQLRAEEKEKTLGSTLNPTNCENFYVISTELKAVWHDRQYLSDHGLISSL